MEEVMLDVVEGTRFLGPEFLVWLWFRGEMYGTEIEVEGHGAVEVWLDAQLVFESQLDSTERMTLRGASPSGSPESLTAMRQGKLPVRARVALNHGKLSYTFGFDAQRFAISNLKIPAVVEEGEEVFYERMMLVEQLDQLLGALYVEFLMLRISPEWDATLVPAIQRWVSGEEALSEADYKRAARRARQAATKA